MIYVALSLVAVIILREWLIYRERQTWMEERRELTSRVQAPHIVPTRPSGPPEVDTATEQHRIAWAQVGQRGVARNGSDE